MTRTPARWSFNYDERDTRVLETGDKMKLTVLGTMVIMLMLTALTLSIALGLLYRHYKGLQKDLVTSEEQQQVICSTPECTKTAARFLQMIDQNSDPCDDFYTHACGQWKRRHPIPMHRNSYSVFDEFTSENDITLNDYARHIGDMKNVPYGYNMKAYYMSCMDTKQIEKLDLSPLENYIGVLGGWPLILNNGSEVWSESSFAFEVVLALLQMRNTTPFLTSAIRPVADNVKVQHITIYRGNVGMLLDYFHLRRYKDAYAEYVRDIVRLFQANMTAAEVQIQEMIDMEIKVAKILKTSEQRNDTPRQYSMRELDANIPCQTFRWFDYLRELFDYVGVGVNLNTTVVLTAPEYTRSLMQIFDDTSLRTIANYVIWRAVCNVIDYLPSRFAAARVKFYQIMGDVTIGLAVPRWKTCVRHLSHFFGMPFARAFMENSFDRNDKDHALLLVDSLKQSLYDLLDASTWLNDITRTKARQKIEAIGIKIGFSDLLWNNTYIYSRYGRMDAVWNRFFENSIGHTFAESTRYVLESRHKTDRWDGALPFLVKRGYDHNTNILLYTASALLQANFNNQSLRSINFGASGSLIAQDLIRALDTKYNDEAYRSQCYEQQQQKEDRSSSAKDSYKSHDEHMILLGGIKVAYQAYLKAQKDKSLPEDDLLPGLPLTGEQIFFLSFTQMYCENKNFEYRPGNNQMKSEEMTAKRVNDILSNYGAFSEAFNCSRYSRMNAPRKCSLW